MHAGRGRSAERDFPDLAAFLEGREGAPEEVDCGQAALTAEDGPGGRLVARMLSRR